MNTLDSLIGYGMLWRMSDDHSKDPAKEIHKAIDYYVKKYSNHPSVIFIHPSVLPVTISNVKIKTTEYMLVNTILVGETNEQERSF